MNTKSTFLLLIVLIGLVAQTPAKRIYVKRADGSAASAGQRMQDIAASIGSMKHDFPQLNSASIEVN
jgi:hypothetical protein